MLKNASQGAFTGVNPVFVALGTALLSAWLFVGYEGPLSLTNQLLALATVNVAMLPSALYFSRRQLNSYPLFEMICAFFAVLFGWTAFSEQIDWLLVPQEVISKAFIIALIALLAFIAGFFFSRFDFRALFRATLGNVEPRGAFLSALGILMLAVAAVCMVLPGRWSSGTVDQIRIAMTGAGLCLAWIRYYSADSGVPTRFLVVTLTAAIILISALSASLKHLMTPVIAIALTYWRVHHRLPIPHLVVLMLIYFLLNPVKFYWRDKTWGSTQPVSLVQNVVNFAESFEEYYFGSNVRQLKGDTLSINRLSDIPILARAVEYTPKYVDHWDGASLKALPYALVPRFIWPDKPVAIYGNAFGRIYRLLSPNNFHAAINISWVTELFVNFGVVGVFLGMVLVGFVTSAVQNTLGTPGVTHLQFSIGVGAAGELYNASQNLALIWGGLPLRLLLLIVFCKLVKEIFERRVLPITAR